MTKKSEFLFKQAEELFSLRERNIQNIGSSSSSYFTVLGLVSAALAMLLDNQDPTNIDLFRHITLMTAWLAVYCYGCFTRKNIWSSYINQIFHTRMLNMTRFYLARNKKIDKLILLPTKGDKPKIDDKGYLNQNFSKNDVIWVLKLINTITMAALVYGILILILNYSNLSIYNGNINIFISLSFALLAGFATFYRHSKYDKNIEREAEEKWLEIIENKEKTNA